jgi:predicted transcriptional regulator
MTKENQKQELQVHIGETIDDMGRRFVHAWHRAERAELTVEDAERHVGFETFETFAQVMTPKRLDLLRHVHRHPARSIRALAAALGRDYRRVHADVEALAGAGLLDRDEHGLRADYRTVKMETTIAL